MKILITGATGLVGYHLLKNSLSSDNFDKVIAIGRKFENLEKLNSDKLSLISFDLTSKYDEYKIFNEFGGNDFIWVHCAAAISGADANTLKDVNIEGTKKIIKKALELKIKQFIFISSIAVYGMYQPKAKETNPFKPNSRYGISKVESEQLVTNSDLNWVVFRPPFIGGPHDKNFLFEYGNRIKKHKMPILSRDGIIAFIDARDLGEAIISSIIKEISHEIFNVQSYEISNNEFINLFGDVLGVSKPYGPKIPYHLGLFIGIIISFYKRIIGKSADRGISYYRIKTLTSNRTMDISKIVNKLQYKPKYELKQSLIDWSNSLN